MWYWIATKLGHYPIIWTDRYGFGVTRMSESVDSTTLDTRYTGKSCAYRSRTVLWVGRWKIPLSRWHYAGREFITEWIKCTVAEEIALARAS